MVHDRLLDAEHTDRFRLLILPNVAALSNQQCDQIRAFVRSGGSILATHETSLYDEWGVRRKNFGLADLFGVSYNKGPEGPMQNAYLRLEGRHALLRDLEDATRIIHGAHRLDVRATAQFPARPLTLIPSYPDLPMEEVYPRIPRTDIPEVYLREVGASRIVFFPWDIDRTFWEVLCADHGRLLRNAVLWAANQDQPVTVAGSGVLDLAVWRQKSSLTVHLVNLTKPMMMKGPLRELIPVGEQRVRLRLPDGAEPRKVHLLMSGSTPATRRDGRFLEVVVPSVLTTRWSPWTCKEAATTQRDASTYNS